MRRVVSQGVELIAVRIEHGPRSMRVKGEVPVRL